MRAALAFLSLVFFAPALRADCEYFRISYKLLRCQAADSLARAPETVSGAAADLPDLAESDPRTVARVACDCAYTLSGSGLGCDLDRAEEITSYIGGEALGATCRRGPSLCGDVCPKRLP